MTLSREEMNELTDIARFRVKHLRALRVAIQTKADPGRILQLARTVCGLEPEDEPQSDRSDPPLNSRASQ